MCAYFQTSELCEIAVQPPTSNTGTVEPLAEEIVVGQDIGITLNGMQEGGTYSFTFSCIDQAGNVSNTLSVGPFTIEEARSQSSGTSIQARVRNLQLIGNQTLANELRAKYSNLFPESTSSETDSNLNIGTTVRDLTMAMEGDDVRKLQELLITQGYAIPAGATGYFFTQTRDALAAYQAAHAIVPAVGYFGSITRGQMTATVITGLWW